MGIVIMPYTMASESAKILSEKLKCFRIRREQSKYKHKPETVVINWGCPERPEHIPDGATVINPFRSVATACDKLKAFKAMVYHGVSTPAITEQQDEAHSWLQNGICVLARTILNGHGGKGIVIMDHPDQLVKAPLYTRYIPKKSEWRVHVFNGKIIDATRKVLSENHPDKENVNWKIRNHDNGFIFQRFNPKVMQDNGEPTLERDLLPGDVRKQALKAVKAMDLHFGAVDIIWNASAKRAYVLEINTAPGIADTTSDIYARAFKEKYIDLPQVVGHDIINLLPDNEEHPQGVWPVWPRVDLKARAIVPDEIPAPPKMKKVRPIARDMWIDPREIEDRIDEDDLI